MDYKMSSLYRAVWSAVGPVWCHVDGNLKMIFARKKSSRILKTDIFFTKPSSLEFQMFLMLRLTAKETTITTTTHRQLLTVEYIINDIKKEN